MNLNVLEATDKLPAPAFGATAMLSHGPLVEANCEVFNDADGSQFTLGLDYFEVAEGGIENLSIPEGTRLRVEYFYYATAPVDGTPIATGPTPGWAAPPPVISPQLPVATTTTQTITQTRRLASMMKFGA